MRRKIKKIVPILIICRKFLAKNSQTKIKIIKGVKINDLEPEGKAKSAETISKSQNKILYSLFLENFKKYSRAKANQTKFLITVKKKLVKPISPNPAFAGCKTAMEEK